MEIEAELPLALCVEIKFAMEIKWGLASMTALALSMKDGALALEMKWEIQGQLDTPKFFLSSLLCSFFARDHHQQQLQRCHSLLPLVMQLLLVRVRQQLQQSLC